MAYFDSWCGRTWSRGSARNFAQWTHRTILWPDILSLVSDFFISKGFCIDFPLMGPGKVFKSWNFAGYFLKKFKIFQIPQSERFSQLGPGKVAFISDIYTSPTSSLIISLDNFFSKFAKSAIFTIGIRKKCTLYCIELSLVSELKSSVKSRNFAGGTHLATDCKISSRKGAASEDSRCTIVLRHVIHWAITSSSYCSMTRWQSGQRSTTMFSTHRDCCVPFLPAPTAGWRKISDFRCFLRWNSR